MVVELPAAEVPAFTFGFSGWVPGLVVELLAIEVVASTFGFGGWSGVLAVVLLLVAFEVGRGLAFEPLGSVSGFSDWVEVAVGRYALLIEAYVSKIIYNDGLEDAHINKSSNLS